ncbi:MAG: PKD domain-containing protein, partial [Solirubrobacteraceae bacterium]
FTAPATGQTGVVVEFNGSSSYDISEPISTYEWNYGDGSPPETTTGATPTHYYIAPGTYQVSLTVSDSSGSADASTQMLPITVTGNAIGLPTASIVSPAANQTYTVGQAVATSFSCAEAVGGPGIESCTDSSGATSPGTLDTSTAGPHTYTVTAVSRDGQRGTATIQYTVTAQSTNSGAGGTQQGSGSTQQGPGSSGSTSGTKPVSTSAKPAGLSKAQKLAQALKACKKKPKTRRASCERQARKTYGSKPKSKARHKKAKSHG